MSTQSQALKKGALFLLSFIFLIAIGLMALWNFDFGSEKSISNIWAQASGPRIAIAMFLISMSMPFVAMRWRALLQEKEKTNPVLLTGILSAAFVFNLALPGPVGELLSASMLKNRYQIPISKGLSGLLVSRIIGLGSACAIAGTMYWVAPLELSDDWDTILQLSAVLLLLGGTALAVLGVFPDFFLEKISSITTTGWKAKILDVGKQLFSALVETASLGRKAYFESIFWAFMGHLMVASGIFVAAGSIGITLSWTAIAFTYAASIAASVAMFMLPGSSVAWDLLFTSTLSLAGGISLVEAGLITLVVRIQQLIVVLIGLLMLFWLSRDLLDVQVEEEN